MSRSSSPPQADNFYSKNQSTDRAALSGCPVCALQVCVTAPPARSPRFFISPRGAAQESGGIFDTFPGGGFGVLVIAKFPPQDAQDLHQIIGLQLRPLPDKGMHLGQGILMGKPRGLVLIRPHLADPCRLPAAAEQKAIPSGLLQLGSPLFPPPDGLYIVGQQAQVLKDSEVEILLPLPRSGRGQPVRPGHHPEKTSSENRKTHPKRLKGGYPP